MSNELEHPRSLTSARTSLGLTGPAIPTREHLRFQLDHALARDAVHTPLDVPSLVGGLQQRCLESLVVSSAAQTTQDRATYLRRPDLGRTLSLNSRRLLEERAAASSASPDIVFILADGLSAFALERHALSLLDELLPQLAPGPLALGPVIIATGARVALGDEIGQAPPRSHGRRPHRRTSRPQFARLSRRLPHLAAPPRPHRRRTQLHLQHPFRRPQLLRRGQPHPVLSTRSPPPSNHRCRSQRRHFSRARTSSRSRFKSASPCVDNSLCYEDFATTIICNLLKPETLLIFMSLRSKP